MVEAFHGPDWYVNERYAGPTTFDYPMESFGWGRKSGAPNASVSTPYSTVRQFMPTCHVETIVLYLHRSHHAQDKRRAL